MRRILIATVIAGLLAGCGASPTAPRMTRTTKPAPTATVSLVSNNGSGLTPTVAVKASAGVSAAAVATSKQAAADLMAADMSLDAMELIQDGGGYFVQGFFGDLWDSVKRTWTNFKLSLSVKSALKHNNDKAFELHEGEIDTLKKNRTAPITKINPVEGGGKEIVSTWTSTANGTMAIEVHRTIDEDGITQMLSLASKGTDKKGVGIDVSRIRKLTSEAGNYSVATKRTTTAKDGRKTVEEWLKEVNVNGSEKITGFIIHPDGHRTDITGTRDLDGKVNVEVTKIAPPAEEDED